MEKKDGYDTMGMVPALPRSRGVQRQDVWAAADAVLLKGEKPTIERIRQHMGTGSPNTVGPYLEQWFKHLGKRIQNPDTFVVPQQGLPEPVLQAAQHLWEAALAQTRSDFDDRLQEGLKVAASTVEMEQARADQAVATADRATTKAVRLQSALSEMEMLLNQARADLAAQQARLDEVRSAWALANERIKSEREERAQEVTEIKAQLAAAMDRADAADRRVAMELERERTQKARAERQAQALQKNWEASQAAALSASEQARQVQQVLIEREDALKANLAAKTTALSEAQQRINDLHAQCFTQSIEASQARAQVVGLQQSLDRLTTLLKESAQRTAPSERRRVGKNFAAKKRP